MSSQRFTRRRYFFLSLLSLVIPLTSNAQVLEEIVVTAQKREQELQDVGISVTAFSGEQLKQLGFTSTTEIDMHTPGLMVTDYGNGVTTVFTIRGSSQLDFADQQEPPVAVYVDGAYNSYLAGVGFLFYDLERIEVLRGAQGTLFGRNATGGLVHLISKKPTREPEGYVELTGGDFNQTRLEGAISGPLGDSAAGRLSLAYDKSDGYVENRGPLSDSQETDNTSVRGQVLFEPSEEVTVLLNARFATDDISGQIYDIGSAVTDVGGVAGLPGDGEILFVNNQQHFDWCSGPAVDVFGLITSPALGATDCAGFFEPNDGPFKVVNNTEGFYKRDHVGTTATIDWAIGENVGLTSITDWQDFTKDYLEDTDSTSNQLFDFFQNMKSSQFSQEVRIAGETKRSRWLAGAYYLNIDSSYMVGVDGVGAFGVFIDNNYDLETTTYAGFLQGEFDFSEKLTGIAGFRWTEDEKDYVFTPLCDFEVGGPNRDQANCFIFGPQVAAVGIPPSSRDEGDWSGLVELDYRPNDDWLLYGKISRGHKAGGWNGGGTAFFLPSQATYNAETPTTFELGLKASLGPRTRLNSAIFYTDYKDFQTFTQEGLSLLLFNVDAEVTGGEIELITNPGERWEFLLGLSVLDANQKDLAGPGGVKDRPMPNAPDVTLNGLGRYTWPVGRGDMALQLDFNYVDERSLNAIDHEALIGESYSVANAKWSYMAPDNRWQFDLWVKNFTDEEYVPTIFDLTGITGVTIEAPAPPRWLGATFTYRWGQ